MSPSQPTATDRPCPPDADDLRRQLHQRLDAILDQGLDEQAPASFLALEQALLGGLRSLGQLLLALFLLRRHQRLSLAAWLQGGRYRSADGYAPRTLKTACGPVTSGRVYLTPPKGKGPGVHPLDVALGLSRDAFSPLVIGWFCRLATRLSYQLAAHL